MFHNPSSACRGMNEMRRPLQTLKQEPQGDSSNLGTEVSLWRWRKRVRIKNDETREGKWKDRGLRWQAETIEDERGLDNYRGNARHNINKVRGTEWKNNNWMERRGGEVKWECDRQKKLSMGWEREKEKQWRRERERISTSVCMGILHMKYSNWQGNSTESDC